MNKKRNLNKTQMIRHGIQILAYVFFPGVMLSTFNAFKDVTMALVSGSFQIQGMEMQLLLIAGMTLLTVLGGRFFCGYFCTFGSAQELVAWISKKIFPKKKQISPKMDAALKYIKFGVLLFSVLGMWVLQLPVNANMTPWGVLEVLVSDDSVAVQTLVPTVGFVLLMGILVGSFFVERFFCRYFCPMGAMFSLFSRFRLIHVRKKEGACVNCGLCSRQCPMGIEVHKDGQERSGECIQCMKCTGACRLNALKMK